MEFLLSYGSKCVIVKPKKMRRPRLPRGCRAIGGKKEEKRKIKMAVCFST
jgi:hypothetical protein